MDELRENSCMHEEVGRVMLEWWGEGRQGKS